MKISDVSKAGQEKKKFLEQRVNMEVTGNDGSKETWSYTVQELLNEFADIKKNMAMVTIFAQAMAEAFYAIAPDHEFFQTGDKKLIEFLRAKKEHGSMSNSLSRLQEAIEKIDPKNPAIKDIAEKVTAIERGANAGLRINRDVDTAVLEKAAEEQKKEETF